MRAAVQRDTLRITDDWDAQLYRLVEEAERVFGKDALNGAMMRAYNAATASQKGTLGPRKGTPFAECLRIELQRSLRAH